MPLFLFPFFLSCLPLPYKQLLALPFIWLYTHHVIAAFILLSISCGLLVSVLLSPFALCGSSLTVAHTLVIWEDGYGTLLLDFTHRANPPNLTKGPFPPGQDSYPLYRRLPDLSPLAA